jgi:hypothetical protein
MEAITDLLHFLHNKLDEAVSIDVMSSFELALDPSVGTAEGIIACSPHKLFVLKKDPTTRFSVRDTEVFLLTLPA